MKLEFQLLVVDDEPDSIDYAIAILSDHLEARGFSLKRINAPDLSPDGIRRLARQAGRDYDLVAVDYNLKRQDTNGAKAAASMRRDLQYTDMVFYSSAPLEDLYDYLAKEKVQGVFVANRGELGDSLVGLADTVIGKAVDLNHMRGIAMAEVAEMDVLMEAILEQVFSSEDADLVKRGKETLQKLLESTEESLASLRELATDGNILDVVTDGRIFSSMHRFMAIKRVAKCLPDPRPTDALNSLKTYDVDIIQNRNTLAHAKEDILEDGTILLRAIKRGKDPIAIDDQWMISFRSKLRTQRSALVAVCDALRDHVQSRSLQELEKRKA